MISSNVHCGRLAVLLAAAFFSVAIAVCGTPQQQKVPVDPMANVPVNSSASAAEKYFSDVEVMDQDGRKLRFYSDVLKGRVVVIHSFLSTCESQCPTINKSLQTIQDTLGDRFGKDVWFVSISVDPEKDTAPVLKKYAVDHHAKPGWLFLTGDRKNVDWALYKVGLYVEKKEEHLTLMMMGNEPTGLWRKVVGTGKVEALTELIRSTIANK